MTFETQKRYPAGVIRQHELIIATRTGAAQGVSGVLIGAGEVWHIDLLFFTFWSCSGPRSCEVSVCRAARRTSVSRLRERIRERSLQKLSIICLEVLYYSSLSRQRECRCAPALTADSSDTNAALHKS